MGEESAGRGGRENDKNCRIYMEITSSTWSWFRVRGGGWDAILLNGG